MRTTCQSYSPQNSYISGTATKHKDVNTLKVNSRTNHFYCFAHLLRWLDVSEKAKLSVKMWNVTFEATYHTTVWGKFIYFIKRLFHLQPRICSQPPLDLMSDFSLSFFFFFLHNRKNISYRSKIKSVFYIVLMLMMIHFVVASCNPSDAEAPQNILGPQGKEDTLRSDLQSGKLTLHLFLREKPGLSSLVFVFERYLCPDD